MRKESIRVLLFRQDQEPNHFKTGKLLLQSEANSLLCCSNSQEYQGRHTMELISNSFQ